MRSELISQHKEVITLITEAINAERIYLLGCTLAEQRTESLFAVNTTALKDISQYYVLVLVKKNDKCGCNAIQDKIESRCHSLVPVTAIVLEDDQFQNWLQEGHPFACKVYKSGERLYDGGNTTFIEPKAIDEQELNTKNAALFNQGINKVQEFLAGADLFRIREQNKMAAFMLHQATEQALITLLKIMTGLHLNTHSIDRLIRTCSLICDKFACIFPRNNDKNERLFQLIQKAYIDTRYKEDYCISIDNLLILTDRVRALEKFVKEVCSNRLKEAGAFKLVQSDFKNVDE